MSEDYEMLTADEAHKIIELSHYTIHDGKVDTDSEEWKELINYITSLCDPIEITKFA